MDYENVHDMRYKLVGVDTVISTVSGPAQLSLIDAAAEVHVRRFVPAEFEGPPMLRPEADILDRGKRIALARLYQQQQSSGMQYTVFTCGVFYERFHPGGMAALQLGQGTNISGEGDYILDIRHRTADVPYQSDSGPVVLLCMTSAEDVARFIVAALQVPEWPNEFRMVGERMLVGDVVRTAEIMCGELRPIVICLSYLADGRSYTGSPFQRTFHTPESLQNTLTYSVATGNVPQQWRLRHLIATLEGRYDYSQANLNELVSIQPKSFASWLYTAWSHS